MINSLLQLLRIRQPTILTILNNDLYETEISYLEASKHLEYYKGIKSICAERMKRLQREIKIEIERTDEFPETDPEFMPYTDPEFKVTKNLGQEP